MSRNWTEEQKQVISLRNRNILVSAAAGSGKTAVLVERIVSKLTDPEHPVDIDRLLVMTFTRAAAGEMKERISLALEDALYKDPDNENLQRQNSLIHTAQITTIDGFCAYLIRNYFHLIDLDPGYRIADEGELKLLREDVLEEVLEEKYAKAEPEFLEFVECYASGKTDDGIREMILRAYDAAMSNPDPEQWLKDSLAYYQSESVEELRDTPTMQLLWSRAVKEELEEAERLIGEAKNLCAAPGGPYLYEEALDSDLILIRQAGALAIRRAYDEIGSLLASPAFMRLSTRKMTDVEPEIKERVKELREEVKGILKDLGARLFPGTEEQVLLTVQYGKGPMEALASLVLSFKERFSQKKREKNLLDFTDMEHFALQILMEKNEDGSTHMTQAARELSERYDEVMVDEYQDSNLIQELLTTCVSGWVNERKNIFMVGDVKQSIYRFRLARPELFMEKYHTYQLTDSPQQRIDLHKNFRSRREVLEGVNYIFRQIMGEDLGGIAYDDAAALYPGAVFPEGGKEDFFPTEVLIVEKDGEELADEKIGEDARELEALAIVHRIQSMVGKEQIADQKNGTYRPVEYGDIVVLLRTASGWSETFSQVFEASGIPVYTASRTGYFSTLEIVTVLNYLRICDNPLQDIPLCSVLRSPIVGLTTQELGLMRSEYPEGLVYDSICACLGLAQNEEESEEEREEELDEEHRALKKKLQGFMEQLDLIRTQSEFTPIHELILMVLEVTGYGSYARALPGGLQRSANLNMLVEKARDYEKTSYRGLFNFIRYIEKLQKYEVDFGEVNLAEAGSEAVRIMTIHKSKGLEFPVVFLAGMGKQFNFQDTNARLLIHPELGFGADAILPKERMVVSTVHKQMMRREILRENLGEELRVLYVALTRAKEKLILIGTLGNVEKEMQILSGYRDNVEALIPIGTRMKARTYWDFVLPALARHPAMEELYQQYGILGSSRAPAFGEDADFMISLITAADLTETEVLHQADQAIREKQLKNWDSERIYDEEIHDILKERFSYQYPYRYLKDIPVKVSVSELKKRSHVPEEEKEESLYYEHDLLPLLPRFAMEEEQASQGAARGTAYHCLMECLDYDQVDSLEEIRAQVDQLLMQQKLDEPETESIRIQDIEQFVSSPVGRRMQKASKAQQLYREQPFVISEKASLLDPAWQGDETVLVQGIIDAYFIEGNEIVLVDYKTDKVRRGGEQELIDRYHVQLEDYAKALERMLSKNVKEAYIYSFTLGKEIRLF